MLNNIKYFIVGFLLLLFLTNIASGKNSNDSLFHSFGIDAFKECLNCCDGFSPSNPCATRLGTGAHLECAAAGHDGSAKL